MDICPFFHLSNIFFLYLALQNGHFLLQLQAGNKERLFQRLLALCHFYCLGTTEFATSHQTMHLSEVQWHMQPKLKITEERVKCFERLQISHCHKYLLAAGHLPWFPRSKTDSQSPGKCADLPRGLDE